VKGEKRIREIITPILQRCEEKRREEHFALLSFPRPAKGEKGNAKLRTFTSGEGKKGSIIFFRRGNSKRLGGKKNHILGGGRGGAALMLLKKKEGRRIIPNRPGKKKRERAPPIGGRACPPPGLKEKSRFAR